MQVNQLYPSFIIHLLNEVICKAVGHDDFEYKNNHVVCWRCGREQP